MEIISEVRAHGGTQGVYRHASAQTGTDMQFAVYVPDHAPDAQMPVIWYLSGLTCTHANVMEKGEYRAACAKHGIIFIAPDTSPRGEDVPDDPDGSYDFGIGAGFYVNATEGRYAANYQMRGYIANELPALISREFPMANMQSQSIMGHSMGGHGALTLALRKPSRFSSVSAFSPIVAPSQVPWGQKAFHGYLGRDDLAEWRSYDSVALIEDGARVPEILVDQGLDDQFLDEQLKPELLEKACADTNIKLTLRRQPGYDHSYFFISTFMAEHIEWHAKRLKG